METGLPKLNFPPSGFRFKKEKDKPFIFDVVRKKFIVLTPEEWVRQNCIHFLFSCREFSINLMGVERSIELNGQKLRFDLVAYSPSGTPLLLVECKSPEVPISQATLDQIYSYNFKLKVPFLLMTNGIQHFILKIDLKTGKTCFLDNIPSFREMMETIKQP
jgi:hypothetical protein